MLSAYRIFRYALEIFPTWRVATSEKDCLSLAENGARSNGAEPVSETGPKRKRPRRIGRGQLQGRDGPHLKAVGSRVFGHHLYRCDRLRVQNLSCTFSRSRSSGFVCVRDDDHRLHGNDQCVGSF